MLELGTGAQALHVASMLTLSLHRGHSPHMASPTLPWIDRALAAAGHPSCEEIVATGRHADPRLSWEVLAQEISSRAGGTVSGEWVRKTFLHLDELTEVAE